MVDRIAPAPGPRERAMAAAFGLDVPVPVTCEPFRQWALEDRFASGRPALEKVGVTFTSQVHAFETMKIRILNGGHAIIAYPGGIKGIGHVHDVMADETIAAFLDRIETDERLPRVPPVPGQELDDFNCLNVERVSHPAYDGTATIGKKEGNDRGGR